MVRIDTWSDSAVFIREQKTIHQVIITLFIPISILFLIANVSNDSKIFGLNFLYNRIFSTPLTTDLQNTILNSVVEPLESFLFLSALITLILFHLNGKNFRWESIKKYYNREVAVQSLWISLTLSLLVFPLFLRSMGVLYGEMSLDPFMQPRGYIYNRVLVPALSYFTHLNGVYYFIFCLLLTYFLIYLIHYWFVVNDIKLSFPELIGLFCGGFVIYQFEFPGYVEQFVFILFLCSLLFSFTQYGRAALIALMLITHESAAVFIIIPVIFFIYPKNERVLHGSVILLYIFTYLINFKFNVLWAISNHQVGDLNSLEWLLHYPVRAVLGIFFAYKLEWVIIIVCIFLLMKNHQFTILIPVISIIFFPFIQLPLATDTSRLIGFGFFGVMVCVWYLFRFEHRKILKTLLLANLVIPSVYVGLNSGIVTSAGLYECLFQALQWFF